VDTVVRAEFLMNSLAGSTSDGSLILQTESQIQALADRIRDSLHPEKIILFGSYAEGTARPDSDIDLLVVWTTDLEPVKRYNAVSKVLDDFGVACDLIVKTPEEYERWRKVTNHIVFFADKYGKVLYGQ